MLTALCGYVGLYLRYDVAGSKVGDSYRLVALARHIALAIAVEHN